MCLQSFYEYGCGCKILYSDACLERLALANNVAENVVLCDPLLLPFMSFVKAYPCFRPECPRPETAQPWRCCECDQGPNIGNCYCDFQVVKEENDGIPGQSDRVWCGHIMCKKCVKYRERRSCVEEKNRKRRKSIL